MSYAGLLESHFDIRLEREPPEVEVLAFEEAGGDVFLEKKKRGSLKKKWVYVRVVLEGVGRMLRSWVRGIEWSDVQVVN